MAVFGAALLASHLNGVPTTLPAAALDWRLLFHIERAAALLASCGVVLVVGWRAMHGQFPTKFAQVEYAAAAAGVTVATSGTHEQRIRVLEVLAGLRHPEDI